jgi:glycosyltransferase involved in cell wall biosynthesis
MKTKLLCILHRSPPAHGAAKVGDFIASSKQLNENFDCRFITIKSSYTIGDIGKVNFNKIYLVAALYFKVVWALLIFRPQKIYFTASVRGVAFYRDLVISSLWKMYKVFKHVDVYYHYHTKGIDDFVSASRRNLKLTKFFIKGVNLILLSPVLEKDFTKISTFNKVTFLPNGVENPFSNVDFTQLIDTKYKNVETLHVLYLSNMIKSKGYFSVLELANSTKNRSIHYHFAGGWQSTEDEKEFFDFINDNTLNDSVTFHGFVNGIEKKKLFQRAHFFVFPTRYHNEAFPLSILESLSYGVPVLATDEASIPYILDKRTGIVIRDVNELSEGLNKAEQHLLNREAAMYCRQSYLKRFSLEQFEINLLNVLEET